MTAARESRISLRLHESTEAEKDSIDLVSGEGHLTTCYVSKYSAMVERHYVKLGYLEFLAVSKIIFP